MTNPRYAQKSWDLTELLPDAAEETISARLAEMESLVQSIEATRTALQEEPSRELLLEVLESYERLTEVSYPPSAYGALWFSQDTQSETALTYKNRMDRALVDFHNRVRRLLRPLYSSPASGNWPAHSFL